MRHVWGLCVWPAIAQGSIFRRSAPFALALLIAAGAPAANAAAPTPTIAAVQDAASNTPNIAQGSLFSVYGTNLSPSSPGLTNFPRPTAVGGVKVTFMPLAGGAGTDTYLIYVGTGQINALLPSTVPAGYYNVTVTNGTVSSPFFVQVVASKVGLFTQDQSGTGLAVVQNYISPSQVDVNRLTTGTFSGVTISPAKPGQTLIAWGTGIGAYAAGDNTANPVHDFSTSEPIAAVVGGVSIPVAFAGRAGYAGEDQINFTLPGNIPTGCVVTLQISVNGVLSAPSYISIAPNPSASACVQPGYTTQQLQYFDQGGTITTGGFSLDQIAETVAKYGNVKSDSIGGSFTQINGFQMGAAGPTPAAITYGSCQVFHITSTNAVSASHSTDLDAGTITLTGPPGTNLTNQKIQEDANSYYYQIGTEGVTTTGSILQGTYTLTGAGGKDVGPFHTSISIGPPLTLISPLPAIVTESAGVTVNWLGGNASDVVYIVGASYTSSGTVDNHITSMTEFICTTTAGQQTFTVPASILTQLPIPPPAQVAGTPNGYLEVVSGAKVTNFNATLKADGSNIPSVFGSVIGAGGTVVYQ
jgi:uncharacterized protein (TIGR03437 family)